MFCSTVNEDLSQAGSATDQIKKSGASDNRFRTPPVILPLPSQGKKKEEEDQFLILTPQFIPNPIEESPKQPITVPKNFPHRAPAPDLIYDSNHLSYRNPDNRQRILEHVIRSQLRKG